MAEACRSGGGILSEADLANYRPRILKETPGRYRDLAYVTCFDPVGLEALNILDQFDLKALGAESIAFRHLMAEAMAAAFVDNIAYYGDPDFGPPGPSPHSPAAPSANAGPRCSILREPCPARWPPSIPVRAIPANFSSRLRRPLAAQARRHEPDGRGRPGGQHGGTPHQRVGQLRRHGRGAGHRHIAQQRHGQFRSQARAGPTRSHPARCRSSPCRSWWL